MPLSRDSEILAKDIYGIVELKPYKVWLLKGEDDSKVVIKTDANITKEQVKAASSVIKAIDPSVKTKVLTAKEKTELLAWVNAWKDIDAFYTKELGKTYKNEEKEAVEHLQEALTFTPPPPEPWLKMNALEIKDLEKALEKRLEGDKSDLKRFCETLKAKGGLEKLGKVVAADLFNGNTDRFMPSGGLRRKIGKKELQFKALVNIGNIFVAATTTGSDVSALDYVDPQSRFKDINKSLSEAEANGEQWPARVLTDKKKRQAFAAEIAHDLELILHPHKHPLSPFTKLGRDAATRIEKGMVEGAESIKKRLEAKFKEPRTQGVRDRLMVLEAALKAK